MYTESYFHNRPVPSPATVLLARSATGIWQSIKTHETVEHDAKDENRKTLPIFYVFVMLRPAPHRPRVWQSGAQLLLRRLPESTLPALDDLRVNVVHELLGVQ